MGEYSFDNFRYWFKYHSGSVWDVVGTSYSVEVAFVSDETVVTIFGSASEEENAVIQLDFSKYVQRPEYQVGRHVLLNPNTDCSLSYQTLLAGTYLTYMFSSCSTLDELKAKYAQQGAQIEDRLSRMLDWLKQTDFYSAPASTVYHDSFCGGLAHHSLNVYNKMLDLIAVPAFKQVSVTSLALVALTHDWCKINYYESYLKNVKDDKTGQWHQEQAWKTNLKGIPLGHGVSSLFLVSRFINVTAEEALAIRWHMGRWHCSDLEVSELQKANETCPLVYLLQFADQLACVKY